VFVGCIEFSNRRANRNMIAALIIIGGIALVGAVLFWPGKRSPSGDSNNPFFIDLAALKRSKQNDPASVPPQPISSSDDSSRYPSNGFGDPGS
jgi:hypothetical protein